MSGFFICGSGVVFLKQRFSLMVVTSVFVEVLSGFFALMFLLAKVSGYFFCLR